MIRATLDVNVLASGFPSRKGVPSELIDRWGHRQFALVLSDHILAGLARTWQKRYFQVRFSAHQAEEALGLLRSDATVVRPASGVRGVADDEEDDLVLATALAGAADYLVTGDKPLQGLGSYQSVVILSPRAFLELLELEPNTSP